MKTYPGLAVDPDADDALQLLRHLDPLEHARRGDEEARHRAADPRLVTSSLARASVAERGVERQPVQVDAERRLDELRVVAAAEPGRDLDHLRARPGRCAAGCTTGPFSIPSASTALGRDRGRDAPTWAAGQTWASATPKAGGSAVTRSVTASGGELAVDREADHRHLRPVDELLDERERRCGRAPARSRSRPAAPPGRATSVSPFWPCRSGALTTHGAVDLRRLVAAADDPPARLRHACLGEPLALAELVRREHRRLRRDRMRQPELLGDPRGDADRPVGARRDRSPSIPSAPTSRSIAGSSSVERMQRRSANRKPGRARVAVDDGDPEAACAARLEQPELCGPRA